MLGEKFFVGEAFKRRHLHFRNPSGQWWGQFAETYKFSFLVNFRTVHRYTGTQVHRYTGTQVHRYTGTQVHRYTGTQVHRYTGTQVHRYTGTQVHRYTGTQVHNLWWSKVQNSFVNAFFEDLLYLENMVRSLFRPPEASHPSQAKGEKKKTMTYWGGRINEVIQIKHVRRIKHAFEKWVFCFFLRRIKHVRVLFDFLNFSCVVTR